MIDLLIHSARQLVTVAGDAPKAGERQGELGLIENGAVAAEGGVIRMVGPSDAVRAAAEKRGIATDAAILDASGKIVVPGFVDPHTHLVFAGWREDEYELRLRGVSYVKIAAAGGGIARTVRDTRAASREELLALARQRLDTMLRLGTTTVEAKSGYGLAVDEEIKCLDVVRQLASQHAMRLVSTFLGAHAVPPEYAGRAEAYVELIVEEMLPAVARHNLAKFCDVFCDAGAFTLEQARQVLAAARSMGLGLKAHADEFVSLGMAAVAASMGAVSVDHAVVTSQAEMALMADNGTVAVLLPATTFHLGHTSYAPARAFIAAEVPVAIGTDLNPGTSMTESMPMVIAIACSQMKMSPAEALVAATLNAAHALGLSKETGSLEAGKSADLLIVDAPDYRHLAYHFGVNLVSKVIQRGRVLGG